METNAEKPYVQEKQEILPTELGRDGRGGGKRRFDWRSREQQDTCLQEAHRVKGKTQIVGVGKSQTDEQSEVQTSNSTESTIQDYALRL